MAFTLKAKLGPHPQNRTLAVDGTKEAGSLRPKLARTIRAAAFLSSRAIKRHFSMEGRPSRH
jgi:hypothetical protein